MSPKFPLRSLPPAGDLPGDGIVKWLPRDRPGQALPWRKKEALLPLVVFFEATAMRVSRHCHIEQRGHDLPGVRIHEPFLGALSSRSVPVNHWSEDPVLGLEVVERDDFFADDADRWRERFPTSLLLCLVDHLLHKRFGRNGMSAIESGRPERCCEGRRVNGTRGPLHGQQVAREK